jgi:SAM-dependent methyltransferase
MTSYEQFGTFYDAVMGDRSAAADYVIELIRTAKPDAKSVLELGCGTGSILKRLQGHYEVSGLDSSATMLSLARKKVPRAKLFLQDMVGFSIAGQFDVIFCVFDSINHIQRLSDWKRVFSAVHRHLAQGGCFIFDINTQRKLERLIAGPPWVHSFAKNLLIITVTGLSKGRSNWNVKVFEHIDGNQFALHEEDIVEVSFPSPQIVAALRAHYLNVRIVDPDRDRPGAKSERLFFTATRR